MLTVQKSIWIEDPPIAQVSRDRHDDILIAAALAAKADYIVTRDDDLKRDPNVAAYLAETGTAVISVRDFLPLLERDPA